MRSFWSLIFLFLGCAVGFTIGEFVQRPSHDHSKIDDADSRPTELSATSQHSSDRAAAPPFSRGTIDPEWRDLWRRAATTIEQGPRGTLRGLVTDKSGRPIEGADVFCNVDGTPFNDADLATALPDDFDVRKIRLLSVMSEWRFAQCVERRTKTASDGTFTIDSLPHDRAKVIEIEHRDYLRARRDFPATDIKKSQGEPIEIVLEAARAVRFEIVFDDGRPVPRSLLAFEGATISNRSGVAWDHVESLPNGKFIVHAVPSDDRGASSDLIFFEVPRPVDAPPIRLVCARKKSLSVRLEIPWGAREDYSVGAFRRSGKEPTSDRVIRAAGRDWPGVRPHGWHGSLDIADIAVGTYDVAVFRDDLPNAAFMRREITIDASSEDVTCTFDMPTDPLPAPILDVIEFDARGPKGPIASLVAHIVEFEQPITIARRDAESYPSAERRKFLIDGSLTRAVPCLLFTDDYGWKSIVVEPAHAKRVDVAFAAPAMPRVHIDGCAPAVRPVVSLTVPVAFDGISAWYRVDPTQSIHGVDSADFIFGKIQPGEWCIEWRMQGSYSPARRKGITIGPGTTDIVLDNGVPINVTVEVTGDESVKTVSIFKPGGGFVVGAPVALIDGRRRAEIEVPLPGRYRVRGDLPNITTAEGEFELRESTTITIAPRRANAFEVVSTDASALDALGLKTGDRIVGLDGVRWTHASEQAIYDAVETTDLMTLFVDRAGTMLDLPVATRTLRFEAVRHLLRAVE